MYPILKENGYLDSEIWTNPNVRKLIQNRLTCDNDQVADIIKQSMPIESLDTIYEVFLKKIECDEIQDGMFAIIAENEIQDDTLQNINSKVFYVSDVYEEIEQGTLKETFGNLLGILTAREQEILKARYGFEDGVEKTLEELGQMFGVTRERIRQIEVKAIRKLSNSIKIRKLKDFI